MIETYRANFLQALDFARTRRGFCAPNPAVGAVIVGDGKVLSVGRHWAAGHPHAEVDAISQLTAKQLQGASIFVTLEPCCHHGRTPPCTELIIRSGITQVFYSQADPNPQVAGKGAQQLHAAGLVCERHEVPEISEFYASYLYWTQTKRPFCTAKLAISADHKIAGPNSEPVAITGAECQQFTFKQRLHCDALLTSATTIINDDPQLNVRLTEQPVSKPVYIIDSRCRLPLSSKIFTTASVVTVLHANDVPQERVIALQQRGAICKAVTLTQDNADPQHLSLLEVMDFIGQQGVHDLWVEAGGCLFQALVEQGLVQKMLIYQSNRRLGNDATPAFQNNFSIETFADMVTSVPCGDDRVIAYKCRECQIF